MRTQRLKTGAYKSKELATRLARRVPPPLRFGAALVYVLIYHKPAGRDPAGAGRSRVFALPPLGQNNGHHSSAEKNGGFLSLMLMPLTPSKVRNYNEVPAHYSSLAHK
jgi:hypothetical protein